MRSDRGCPDLVQPLTKVGIGNHQVDQPAVLRTRCTQPTAPRFVPPERLPFIVVTLAMPPSLIVMGTASVASDHWGLAFRDMHDCSGKAVRIRMRAFHPGDDIQHSQGTDLFRQVSLLLQAK